MRVAAAIVLTALATLPLSGTEPAASASRTPTVTVRRLPHGGIQPQARIDAAGVLHLVYFAGEARAGDLFYVRSTDLGATFSAPVRVNQQPGSAIATGTIRGGQLALGRSGRIHVAWNGSDAASTRGVVNPHTGRATAPFLYTQTDASGAFVPERNLMRATYDLDGGGAIAADESGHVYAVWHANGVADPAGEAARRVWVARSSDGGGTFEAEQAVRGVPTGVCGCCGLSAVAHGPRLEILFRSVAGLGSRDVRLLVSDDRGQSARESLVQPWRIDACPMSSMSLLASAERELGAWETAGQVYFAAIDPARAAIATPTPAPGDAVSRKHPRLALARDRVLLLWTEGTAWARGGSLAWQVFEADGAPAGPGGAAPGVPVWSFGAAVASPAGDFVVFY